MTWQATAIDSRSLRTRIQVRALRERARQRTEEEARTIERISWEREASRADPAAAARSTEPGELPASRALKIPSARSLRERFGLTEREAEITRLLVWGDSNKAIARKLEISSGTVRKHVEHVLGKLDASSRRVVIRTVLNLRPPAA